MLITITLEPETDSQLDATALSHLLRKHPGRLQTFELSVGNAHVFYPEYSPERTTAALLLEVDAVGLVRNKRFRGDNGVLDYYINDRPFTASSLLAVALGKVLRSAMTETSEAHPELGRNTVAAPPRGAGDFHPRQRRQGPGPAAVRPAGMGNRADAHRTG